MNGVYNMTINVGGGGGVLDVETISGIITVSPGATGAIFVITPASGKSVRLTYLTQYNSTNRENGLTLTVGSKTLFSGKNLYGVGLNVNNITNNDFSIGANANAGYTTASIQGKPGEAITLTKDVGSTVQRILYAYEVGQ
jgi:hypothetical protein